MGKALVVVDVQIDFTPGGSLPVPNGEIVAAHIARYIEQYGLDNYDTMVASKDFHVDPKGHFSETPNYVDTWPPHCLAGTSGARFHPNFSCVLGGYIDAIFHKGLLQPAYSAFEGVGLPEDEEDGIKMPIETGARYASLDTYLKGMNIEEIDVVGIELRNCVKSTALDAIDKGYKTRLLRNLVASLGGPEEQMAINEMQIAGVDIV